MSHTKASVSWTLAAKRCSERYLFHPWNTSETWRSRHGRQTSLLFQATDRKKIQKDISLVTGRTSPDYLYCCLCVCLWRECYYWGQKIKGRENNTSYSLNSFPPCFSSAEMHHPSLIFSSSFGCFLLIIILIFWVRCTSLPLDLPLVLCLTNWSCLCLLWALQQLETVPKGKEHPPNTHAQVG